MLNTTMIFNQEVSERELQLRHDLIQAQKDYRAMPDVNTKEGRGKLFKIRELTQALRTERESRQARERAVRELNGKVIDPRVFRGFKIVAIFLSCATIGWVYLSGDVKAESLATGIMATLTMICWLMYLFGYLYRKD